MSLVLPRTLRFLATSMLLGEVAEAIPAPAISLGLAAQVAIDEAVLAMALGPTRFPDRDDYHRVGAELARAKGLYLRRGWMSDPAAYHRTPPPLTDDDVRVQRSWAMGLAYDQVRWESGYKPWPGEPGRARWESYAPNQVAAANVLRHPGPPRPWVICVHGYCTGYPLADFQGLHAARLHRELGLNVAMPTLPLHGPRRITRMSGVPFLSFEMTNVVFGLAQSVWDIRRLTSWIRSQPANESTPVGIFGISLGAYVTSLVTGIEDGFDCAVAGIPVIDFPALFMRHSPRHVRERSLEHRIMGGPMEAVHRVVSPLSFPSKVPQSRRFVFAGYGDRLALPTQAQQLWEHWDRPAICWFPGNHVCYLLSRQATHFLRDSLSGSGFAVGQD